MDSELPATVPEAAATEPEAAFSEHEATASEPEAVPLQPQAVALQPEALAESTHLPPADHFEELHSQAYLGEDEVYGEADEQEAEEQDMEGGQQGQASSSSFEGDDEQQEQELEDGEGEELSLAGYTDDGGEGEEEYEEGEYQAQVTADDDESDLDIYEQFYGGKAYFPRHLLPKNEEERQQMLFQVGEEGEDGGCRWCVSFKCCQQMLDQISRELCQAGGGGCEDMIQVIDRQQMLMWACRRQGSKA